MNSYPLVDERIHRPHKLDALIETLLGLGVGATAALAGTGLQRVDFQRPDTRVSAQQILAVCANALRLSPQADVALQAGLAARVTHFGLYGYALLSSPSAREAINMAVKYRALAAPVIGLSFAAERDLAIWRFHDVYGLGEASPLYRFVLEWQLGTQMALHRDVMGKPLRPLAVRLPYRAPEHAARYRDLLGCVASFEAQRCELCFDGGWLDHAPAQGNPAAALMATETCERLLTELHSARGLSSKLIGLLMQTPGQFPSIETIAGRWQMSSRTLRRKLLAEGNSYQQLLDRVRCQLAVDYLRQTRLSQDDIAAALGFSEAANFRQAFRRWTGKTPGAMRRAHRA